MDINKVILVGRLTKEIELKSTTNGSQYIQFDIAVGNGKDKEGNERGADFINCVAWNKAAENLSVYLHKGNRVAIEGRLKVDKYQNEKGENKYKTYVRVETYEFLESKPKDTFVPQEPESNKVNYTAEEIDSTPLPNDPFENQEQFSFNENDLPF